jgi:hypothetical protein
LPQRGGCACGALRYALKGAPLLAYACHCHTCQTRSGAAFSLTLVVRSADLTLIGEPEMVARLARDGRQTRHSYCPACRVPVTAIAPVAPDYMSVRVGTLDDASWVIPIAQTFVESAIPWAVIPGVRQVAWEAFDFESLGREWVVSAPRFAPG